MTAPTQRTIELMIKQYTGEITPAEQAELEDLIAQASPAKQQWYRDMLDPLKLAEAMAFAQGEDLAKYQQQWEANARQQWKEQSRRRLHRSLRWAAAAVLVIATGLGIWQWIHRQPSQEQSRAIAGVTEDGESFFLLPGGEKIELGSLTDRPTKAGNALLSRHNNELICQAAYTEGEKPGNIRLFVKHAIYTLLLHDSSRITLGQRSAVQFPDHFNKGERVVEISGEGYFEVKHKLTDADTARVIIVKNALDTLPQHLVEVQALGTRFNIRAYANDTRTRITLDEGSLQICKNTTRIQLHPGEEATITSTGITEKHQISKPGEASAWREGRILFTDIDVTTIMNDLKRHYDDISIAVAPEVADEKISLHSFYNKPIGYLVDIMKKNNSNIAIKMEGNTIYVTPPIRH
ncbi:DUF4974 domain-containing protein [Paraflavitalea soli]|uniref:DUF4974 domain-containing protein n=1 Tax=Paraflavitalea soli TaxID=2315862 RepID=A0A3B7MKS7_9BACT|nr:FecR domain-containing protein [Paraflavitalea soli]AXY74778.1 DUF4974 domain-containing protein [Paraflavitalea soli]